MQRFKLRQTSRASPYPLFAHYLRGWAPDWVGALLSSVRSSPLLSLQHPDELLALFYSRGIHGSRLQALFTWLGLESFSQPDRSGVLPSFVSSERQYGTVVSNCFNSASTLPGWGASGESHNLSVP